VKQLWKYLITSNKYNWRKLVSAVRNCSQEHIFVIYEFLYRRERESDKCCLNSCTGIDISDILFTTQEKAEVVS
jgi:hypothetical protein